MVIQNPDDAQTIALIIVYFGRWPIWFPAFLQSCRYNPSIDWLIFTDCPIPELLPANVNCIPFSSAEFNSLASRKLNSSIKLPYAYKLADFKPTFGFIFDDFLRGYRFWGHCDLDIVWGDIRHFINDEILSEYQFISARKNKMCGHFSLYRNEPEVSTAFMRSPGYLDILQSRQYLGFDEIIMTRTVKQIAEEGKMKVYWPKFFLNFVNPRNDSPSVLGKLRNRWLWENGKLFEIDDLERKLGQVAYLHFMTWKRSIKACYVAYSDNPEKFYISYSHISLTKLDPIPYGSSVRWELDKAANIASRIWRRIRSFI